MECHDRHLGLGIVAFVVHDERHVFEHALQVLEVVKLVAQFLEVFQAPRRLGRLVVLPHGGVARVLENLFGKFDMGLIGW